MSDLTVPPLPVVAYVEHHKAGDNLCFDHPGGRHSELTYKADADAALASLQPFADVGRAMVELTTTVRGQDEWPAIPGLWQRCMEERDAALSEVASLQARMEAAERDAARYGAIRTLLVSLVLRTPKGSTITLTAPTDRPANGKGLDAALDGLLTGDDVRAAIDAATSQEGKE